MAIASAAALAGLTALAGTAAVGAGAAGAFGAFGGGDGGPSRSDILGAAQRDIATAQAQQQKAITAGRQRITDLFEETRETGLGLLGEQAGARGLVGIGPNVLGAATPTQRRVSDFLKGLFRERTAAEAQLTGQEAQFATSFLPTQLGLLESMGPQDKTSPFASLLQAGTGIAGTVTGFQQGEQQNQLMQALIAAIGGGDGVGGGAGDDDLSATTVANLLEPKDFRQSAQIGEGLQ